MKKLLIILAAATMAGCGKDDDEVLHSVADVKSKLIGTWEHPSFSFPSKGVPETFYSTTCDTIKSSKFKPFDYDKGNTVQLNEALFNHLLTSITFSDDNTASDEVKVTFEFKECDAKFTEKFKIIVPPSSNENFIGWFEGTASIVVNGQTLSFSSTIGILLYRTTSS
jgi:hypothetical protein